MSASTAKWWTAWVRVFAACAMLALALWAVFIVLLALAVALPSNVSMTAHLREATERGVLQPVSYPRSPFGHIEHQYDLYTDCVALGMNLGATDLTLAQRIAAAPTSAYEHDDAGPCRHLVDGAAAGALRADFLYPRFWHGYQVWFRPLLAVTTLDFVRQLTALLFLTAMGVFGWRLAQLFGPAGLAAGLAPFFLFSDFLSAAMVSTHALSLAIAFGSATWASMLMERRAPGRALILPLFAFGAGMIYNYVNFLINPPIAPTLIAFFYIAANLRSDWRGMARTTAYGLGLAMLWYGGFVAAWIEKWLLVAAVMGPDAILSELGRAFGDYDETRVAMDLGPLSATRRNVLSTPAFFFWMAMLAILGAALAAWTMRDKAQRLTRALHFAAMLTPLAMVLLWVEVNQAHSAQHSGFVSRAFVLFAVLPILAALKLLRDAMAARRMTNEHG